MAMRGAISIAVLDPSSVLDLKQEVLCEYYILILHTFLNII